MVRFKNLGRDINANPVQLRVWITDDLPGDDASYTGPRAGHNPLLDITSYIIYDDNAIVDFNFPLATQWSKTYEVLPNTTECSSLAVIDGYIYLFGGRVHNKILRARTADPGRWKDTGATLPDNSYGSHLAVIGDYIYLFGGNDGYAVSNIYSAPTADPLSWTDHGPLLPEPRCFGQLVIVDDTIYLYGGKDSNAAKDSIYSAPIANPLNWTDTGNTLPDKLYASQVMLTDSYVLLLGGAFVYDDYTNKIYVATTSDPTTFIDGYVLPYQVAYGQVCAIGENFYYYTATGPAIGGESSFTRILTATKTNPFVWTDTLQTIPGQVDMSQIAIIYDRIFSFGGSGSSAIFASDPYYKYVFDDSLVVDYGENTRTNYNLSTEEDLFKVLGFPFWKANYNEV